MEQAWRKHSFLSALDYGCHVTVCTNFSPLWFLCTMGWNKSMYSPTLVLGSNRNETRTPGYCKLALEGVTPNRSGVHDSVAGSSALSRSFLTFIQGPSPHPDTIPVTDCARGSSPLDAAQGRTGGATHYL